MSLTFGTNPWFLLLCALGAAAVTYWTYRRTVPPIGRGWRLALGGLRFLALFLVLFLLFEPVLRRLSRSEEPPVLAVLVDDSQSLRLTTGADSLAPGTTAPAVRRTLQHLARATEDATLRYFAFDGSLRPLAASPGAAIDSLRLTGSRTDIGGAPAAVRERLRHENLRGIVLVSDGQYNTGRNPLYLAARSPVPIHTVIVGDTTRRRDVQVRRITTNDLAYVDTQLPVQAEIRAEGYGGATVEVVLTHDGRRLDAAQITLPEGASAVPIELRFRPEAAGLQRFTVGVSRLDGEATFRNNTASFSVRVLESKRRVLLLAAAPTPDVAAFRQLLTEDPHIEVVPFIHKSEGTFYQGPLPSDLSTFDVLLLAGFPGTATTPETAQRVAQTAEAGTPLLFFLNQQTDLSLLADYFSQVLPAVPEVARPGFVEALFAPTARADRHPIFDLAGAPTAEWTQLPPLQVSRSRWTISPDARVLAEPMVRGVRLEAPLLVTRRRTGDRTIAFLGAGIWRWTNVPEGLAPAAERWSTLFSNMIQWVSAEENDRPVRVRPVRTAFAGSEPVRFTGQVYDESLTPVEDASVQVTIIGPGASGTRTPYQMDALGNGRYIAEIGTLPEGTYRFTARAVHEGDTLGTDRGSFAVGAHTLEYRETRADAALMRQIAQRSGGTFHVAGEREALPARLAAAGTLQPRIVEREQEIPLWRRYGLLAFIVTLLATEWALRKYNGMV